MAHPRVWGNRYLQVFMHYIKQDHIWMYDWAMLCAFVCIFGVRLGMCHDTCLQRTDARYRCAIRGRCCIWARLETFHGTSLQLAGARYRCAIRRFACAYLPCTANTHRLFYEVFIPHGNQGFSRVICPQEMTWLLNHEFSRFIFGRVRPESHRTLWCSLWESGRIVAF